VRKWCESTGEITVEAMLIYNCGEYMGARKGSMVESMYHNVCMEHCMEKRGI